MLRHCCLDDYRHRNGLDFSSCRVSPECMSEFDRLCKSLKHIRSCDITATCSFRASWAVDAHNRRYILVDRDVIDSSVGKRYSLFDHTCKTQGEVQE
jgi:hypothetical protein